MVLQRGSHTQDERKSVSPMVAPPIWRCWRNEAATTRNAQSIDPRCTDAQGDAQTILVFLGGFYSERTSR